MELPSDRWPGARCAEALNQAIALQPNDIVLGTIDTDGQAAVIEAAAAESVVVVDWHATPCRNERIAAHPHQHHDRPLEVARAAASCAIAGSHGAAGVVIFADSVYQIVMSKSDAVAKVIKTFGGCEVLALEDTPLSDVATRVRPLTTALLLRFGDRARHALCINDL